MTASSTICLVYRKIEYFQEMIENKIPFAFSRYGDGEWASILGYLGQNCDGVKYTPELQNALIETLEYPHLQEHYYYGLLAIAVRLYRPYIEKFTKTNNLDIAWTEATFLVEANRNGHFAEFLNTLRKRTLLYVGATHLQRLPIALELQIAHFIEVPDRTAFEERESIQNKILVCADKADFIGFSAGPATKWLIWSLYPDLGETHTLFDFGSIFDGYVGKLSRKYQRRDTWSEIVRANLK